MNPPVQYLSTIVPVAIVLLGLALAACWTVLRRQRFLLWLAIGYILPALTLIAQSQMSNERLAYWAPVSGICLLSGLWAISGGIAQRYGGTAHPRIALLIGLPTLALLVVYSHVVDLLWIRASILYLAMGLLLLLPLRAMFRKPAGGDGLELTLRISYLVLTAYTLARAVLIPTLTPMDSIGELTRSVYWVAMLSITLLFSIWFLLVLLTITLRDVLRVLNDERNHDSLTHLLNRRAFFEAAESSLGDPRKGPWTLLVCDIDHFKMVNDTWGHQAGDKVLHWFGQTLLGQIRRGDLAARFGGEEFAVLLARSRPEDAIRVAERIRQQLAQAPEDDTSIRISASFGLVPVSSPKELNDALARADTLLYEAKRAGRDRIHADGLDASRPDQAA